MFIRLFRDRRAPERAAEELLARLLRHRTLARYRFIRRCTIGPFVAEQMCRDHALIIEIERSCRSGRDAELLAGRARLLAGLGYRVFAVPERELRLRPRRLVGQIRAALQS